jgi:hypothetical protein
VPYHSLNRSTPLSRLAFVPFSHSSRNSNLHPTARSLSFSSTQPTTFLSPEPKRRPTDRRNLHSFSSSIPFACRVPLSIDRQLRKASSSFSETEGEYSANGGISFTLRRLKSIRESQGAFDLLSPTTRSYRLSNNVWTVLTHNTTSSTTNYSFDYCFLSPIIAIAIATIAS